MFVYYVTRSIFGTLVQYKFDQPYYIPLENTTINSLELTTTDKNNNIIDFHTMPACFILLKYVKNNL